MARCTILQRLTGVLGEVGGCLRLRLLRWWAAAGRDSGRGCWCVRHSDAASLKWRQDFIRTYLERDLPQLGPCVPAETLRRFWTMHAHDQSSPLNAGTLARGLGVDGKTVARYLYLWVDLLLVRRLSAWHHNAGKRMVRSPKVMVRDTALYMRSWGCQVKKSCSASGRRPQPGKLCHRDVAGCCFHWYRGEYLPHV